MAVQDSVAWPPGYRALMKGLSTAGAVLGVAAGLAAIAWTPWFWGLALGGALVAVSTRSVARHMAMQPMLAIEDGELLCRLEASNSRRSAQLTRVVRFELDQIESVHCEVQPWPGAGGERHVYRVRLLTGIRRGLVPRPTDAPTREAMAAFFERHLPGKVTQTRPG